MVAEATERKGCSQVHGGEVERMKWAGSWWLKTAESKQVVSRKCLTRKPLSFLTFISVCLYEGT